MTPSPKAAAAHTQPPSPRRAGLPFPEAAPGPLASGGPKTLAMRRRLCWEWRVGRRHTDVETPGVPRHNQTWSAELQTFLFGNRVPSPSCDVSRASGLSVWQQSPLSVLGCLQGRGLKLSGSPSSLKPARVLFLTSLSTIMAGGRGGGRRGGCVQAPPRPTPLPRPS